MLLGPSGSGKTTLLALGAGLDRPTEGTVELVGHPLTTASEDEKAVIRRENVGFVFQSFNLIPSLTALENVLLPAELCQTGNRVFAAELLAELGLQERINHYPTQLSGGEQQRVALARAFMNRPQILFADEPTGNLDQENGDRALESILRLKKEFHTTILMVTHDEERARRFERTVRIRAGRISEES